MYSDDADELAIGVCLTNDGGGCHCSFHLNQYEMPADQVFKTVKGMRLTSIPKKLDIPFRLKVNTYGDECPRNPRNIPGWNPFMFGRGVERGQV